MTSTLGMVVRVAGISAGVFEAMRLAHSGWWKSSLNEMETSIWDHVDHLRHPGNTTINPPAGQMAVTGHASTEVLQVNGSEVVNKTKFTDSEVNSLLGKLVEGNTINWTDGRYTDTEAHAGLLNAVEDYSGSYN